MTTTPEPIRWSLSTYSSPRLTLLDSDPSAPHALLLLGGLTDTLGSLPYTTALAQGLVPLGISIVLPQLSSGLGGYGISSVEADAREVAAAIFHLRTLPSRSGVKQAIFLLGHSTGCQDIIAYLRAGSGARGEECTIQGAILQGPCSDRLDWQLSNADEASSLDLLKTATELVQKGQGSTLLPRVAMPAPRPAHSRTNGPAALQGTGEPRGTHEDAVSEPPFTAYRYWSLFAEGGDEDYFSLDVAEEKIEGMWREALGGLSKSWKNDAGEGSVQGTPCLMALCGEEDEYTHEPYTSARQVETWTRLANSPTFSAHLLRGANHKVSAAEAQAQLVTHVVHLLSATLGLSPPHNTATAAAAATTSEAPSHPASFDAIVELISTGRADAIPGIRQIPLVINEAAPSASALARPPKPWERAQDAEVQSAVREYEESQA